MTIFMKENADKTLTFQVRKSKQLFKSIKCGGARGGNFAQTRSLASYVVYA